jgi:epoxyqueuosine reductase
MSSIGSDHSEQRRLIARALTPVLRWLGTPPRVIWLSHLPAFKRFEKAVPPLRRWDPPDFEVPSELQRIPGVKFDDAKATEAFEEAPAGQWTVKYKADNDLLMENIWESLLPMAPRFIRAQRNVAKAAGRPAAATASYTGTPEELTLGLKRMGLESGLSAIGVTDMDRRYIVAEHQHRELGSKVVVCIAERNYDAVQTGPSAAFEQASLHANGELMERAVALAEYLKSLGYRTEALPFEGVALTIPFAVAAGLGQLGINGQLLTPQAGSRASLCLIATDAPLVSDAPRDFGIEALCDKCLICVRRCPVSAIPAKRTEHKGVLKAKLRLERCLPAVSKVHGCGICMTTCPAQRYGTEAMIDHWKKTGTILGKDTEELEGYTWADGKYYGLRQRPVHTEVFMAMPSFPRDRAAAAQSESSDVSTSAVGGT